jgi:hypothetical protein
MDEFAGPEKFYFKYPVFCVVLAEEVNSPPPFDAIAFAETIFPEDEKQQRKTRYLALFTDEDLVERFCRECNLPPCRTEPIGSREALWRLLDECERNECHHVGLDTGSHRGKVWSIADFRRRRRAGGNT